MGDIVEWDMPIASWDLAQLTFAAPTMLWGALAAAAPILIHLVLRTKAQRVPLPTVRFVIKMQQQTQASQRIRHLLLLLLRTLAILLLVAALARPTLKTSALSSGAREPVEAVFCLDDSASMGYRSRDRTRFEVAQDLAVRLLRDRDRFPPRSRLALLTGSAPTAATRLSLDIDFVRQKAEQLEVADHNRGVAAMLAQAYDLLGEGVLDVREVYVFGDLTRQSWQDVPSDAYTSREDVQVFCIDVGEDTDTNFTLLEPVVPARTLRAGSTATIRFGLRAGQAGGRRHVEVTLDGKRRARLGPYELRRGRTEQVEVKLTNLTPGLHLGEIRLQPDDPLSIDNIRYLSLDVGPLPRVIVVGTPDNQVASIVSAMIAPVGLPADQQRAALARRRPDELAKANDLAGCAAVILADVPSLSKAAFEQLGGYVADGGCLVVVPGPTIAPNGIARDESVLPALPAEVVVPPDPVHVAPLDKPDRLLARFQDGSGLSLSAPAIYRYVRFDRLLGSSQVIAHLDDGAAAIVVRQHGQGRSVSLAFSPIRAWSDFAVDAGPMLVLLNTLVAESRPTILRAGNLRVGQVARLATPRPKDAALSKQAGKPSHDQAVTITSPNRRESWPIAVEPSDFTVQAVTDRCGHYVIHLAEHETPIEFGYSVNTPNDESVLVRTSIRAIEGRFAERRMQCVEALEELSPSAVSRPMSHMLAGWLALALLGVLIAEGFLSNRFYREPEEAGP
jgi:hypothetical protein